MRAAIYERISKDRTGEEAGVKRQDEDCVALARQLDAVIVDKYVDNDVSASDRRKPRRNYLRMIDDVRAGKIDAIICWHTDRLYRQPRELEDLIDLVEEHHTLIRACRAGELDLSTPTGRLVGRLLGAVAKHEVEHKSDRWLRAVRQNREAGKAPGSRLRMFGYTAPVRDAEGNVLKAGGEVVPAEAELVHWMAGQVLRGVSLNSIARGLTARGVSTVTGAAWHTSTVRTLLMNPRIAGLATLNGQVVGQGGWEGLLDEETWRATCALLSSRQSSATNRPRVAVLLDLIFCDCGTRMHTGTLSWRSAAGSLSRTRIYRCPVKRPYDVGCKKVSIKAEPVEELVEAYARGRIEDPVFRKMLSARSAATRSAELSTELQGLEAQYEELKAALGVAQGRTIADVTTAMNAVNDRITALLATLKGSAVELPDKGEWPTGLDRRHALIQLAVERAIVHPADPTKPPRFDPERVELVPTR